MMSKAKKVIEKLAMDDTKKDILSGLAAGAASTFATYPIDTITTRRQVASAAKKGSRGLYSGVGLKLLKNVPGTAITLGTYGVTRRILDKYFPEDTVKKLQPSTIINIHENPNKDVDPL